MSRSKKDWNDTEAMLERLTALLIAHESGPPIVVGYNPNRARRDAESLSRISMTLHRWHELECGDSNSYGSWAIVRGAYVTNAGYDPELEGSKRRLFQHDDDGKPFLEHHHYAHGRGKDSVSYSPMADREAGAKRRLAAIVARYPGVQAYIQTDPRGCALYILPAGSVKEGEDVSSLYSSRGVAVYR